MKKEGFAAAGGDQHWLDRWNKLFRQVRVRIAKKGTDLGVRFLSVSPSVEKKYSNVLHRGIYEIYTAYHQSCPWSAHQPRITWTTVIHAST